MIAKLNDDIFQVKELILITQLRPGEEENEDKNVPRTPPRPTIRVKAITANLVNRTATLTIEDDHRLRFERNGQRCVEEVPQ